MIDLLAPAGITKLSIQKSKENGIIIHGLREDIVKSPDQVTPLTRAVLPRPTHPPYFPPNPGNEPSFYPWRASPGTYSPLPTILLVPVSSPIIHRSASEAQTRSFSYLHPLYTPPPPGGWPNQVLALLDVGECVQPARFTLPLPPPSLPHYLPSPGMVPEQVLALLDEGERNRHVGTTKMNERSSRSHTLFRMVGGGREWREWRGR